MPGPLAQAGVWLDSNAIANDNWNWDSGDSQVNNSIVQDSLSHSQPHLQANPFSSPQISNINFSPPVPRAQSDLSSSISPSNLSPEIHSTYRKLPASIALFIPLTSSTDNTSPTTATSASPVNRQIKSTSKPQNPPRSTSSSPQSPPSNDNDPHRITKKRTLNTLAARRYRQRRIDQMSSLETSLKETETERDELKLRVARLEAEVEVLRGLVGPRA